MTASNGATEGPVQPELMQQQVNIPAEFLAEHGRVCMENAQLRSALDQARGAIQMLVEKVRTLSGEAPAEIERDAGGLPIVRKRPEVVPEGASE